jgi:exonuclease SbcC
MIKSMHIKNFQSHKETTLHFHPGINAIIGPSNNGKSAIQRAFNWVFKNKPLGLSFVSYWNRDKNGNPKVATSVCVEMDEEEVQRVRDKEFNGYRIYRGDELLVKLDGGTEVPEAVLSRLHMSDVNVQNQTDPHFLLSTGAGEVARFFNRIVRLDFIDKLLSTTESRKRGYGQDKKDAVRRIGEVENEISLLQWTERASQLINKAEVIESRLEAASTQKRAISDLLTNIQKTQTFLDGLDFIPVAEKLVSKIEKLNVNIKSLQQEEKRITTIIDGIVHHQAYIETLPDIKKSRELIAEIEEIDKKIKQKQQKIETITSITSGISKHERIIRDCEEEISVLLKKLPEVCPFCGGPLAKLKEG